MAVENDLPIERPAQVTQKLILRLWREIPFGRRLDMYRSELPIPEMICLMETNYPDPILSNVTHQEVNPALDVKMATLARKMAKEALLQYGDTQPTSEEVKELQRYESVAEILEERAIRRASLAALGRASVGIAEERVAPETRQSVKILWNILTEEQKASIIDGISIGGLYYLMHQETEEEKRGYEEHQEDLSGLTTERVAKKMANQPWSGLKKMEASKEAIQAVQQSFIIMLDKEAQKPELSS